MRLGRGREPPPLRRDSAGRSWLSRRRVRTCFTSPSGRLPWFASNQHCQCVAPTQLWRVAATVHEWSCGTATAACAEHSVLRRIHRCVHRHYTHASSRTAPARARPAPRACWPARTHTILRGPHECPPRRTRARCCQLTGWGRRPLVLAGVAVLICICSLRYISRANESCTHPVFHTIPTEM